MSYRDIRNCTEMLRTVGYPHLVSLESFRRPNFPLVASLLIWLAKRFEPDAEITPDIETEEDRVQLIRNVAQFMALKANIKLNTKRLYQADGYAVKEILKITSLLYEAIKSNNNEDSVNNADEAEFSLRDFDIADKLHDLKQSRQLASEITTSGASLFELLGKEIELRVLRNSSATRQYEVTEVDEGLKKAVESIKQEINDTKELIDNVSATEANLDNKIERRKVEIDRYEKRLQTLKKVRPAFLEEFNSLELELNQLFEQYSLRSRCLAQLEKLASDAERLQLERHLLLASTQKSLLTTVPLDEEDAEDPNVNDIDTDPNSNFLLKESNTSTPDKKFVVPPTSRQERPRARTGGQRSSKQEEKTLATKKFNPIPPGSMSSLSDSDSEDELFLDKDIEPELVHSDEDSLGFELSAMELQNTNTNTNTNNKRAPSGRITTAGSKLQILDNSDDDF